jgi:hypothetical protein
MKMPASQKVAQAGCLGLEELLAETREAITAPWAWVGYSSEGAVVWRGNLPVALLRIERGEEDEYVGVAGVSEPRGLPNPALHLEVIKAPSGKSIVLQGSGKDIPELAKRLAQGVAQVLEGRKFWA